MGQRSSDAVVKNATTMSSKEECVLNKKCRSSYEGAKDAQIAGGVCKRHGPANSQTLLYISKSAQTKQVKWGGVLGRGIGQMMQYRRMKRSLEACDESTAFESYLQLKPYPISMLLELTAEKRRRKECFRKGDVLSQEIVACLGGGMIFWDRSSSK
eukprot:scaffold40854_cov190-Skeletonema_marinoi.AAC.1